MGTRCRKLEQGKIQSCLVLAKFEIEVSDAALGHSDGPKAQPIEVEEILEKRGRPIVYFYLKAQSFSF